MRNRSQYRIPGTVPVSTLKTLGFQFFPERLVLVIPPKKYVGQTDVVCTITFSVQFIKTNRLRKQKKYYHGGGKYG